MASKTGVKKKVLQYTWYPKDWQGSDMVYQIGPVDRCTYREFIDLAMENGNEIPDRSGIWWKKWNYDSPEQLNESINNLISLGAVQVKGGFYSVPSCDKRLERAFRNQSNGKSGGRPPKPRNNPEETETKPKHNPEETQEERPIQYNTIQDNSTEEKTDFPSLEEVIKFCDENGYTSDHAKDIFEYYDSQQWKDKNDQDISSKWKYQVRKIWFKDEGRKPLTREERMQAFNNPPISKEFWDRLDRAGQHSYQIMHGGSGFPLKKA